MARKPKTIEAVAAVLMANSAADDTSVLFDYATAGAAGADAVSLGVPTNTHRAIWIYREALDDAVRAQCEADAILSAGPLSRVEA